MSYVIIWVHAVWGTKRRKHFLTKDVREKLFPHIKQNALTKKIQVVEINGHYDHVHCLLRMNAELSIGKTMQLLKGESAYWANQNQLVRPKLEWAVDYYAASVSESDLSRVRRYIRNQEQHHAGQPYKEPFVQAYRSYLDGIAA